MTNVEPDFVVNRPATKCFSSALEAQLFAANTVIEQGITVSSISNLSSPFLRDQLVEQHKQFLALKKSQAESCGKQMGDELRYMGTATVVRDMDFMSEVFDGEGAKMSVVSFSCPHDFWLILPAIIGAARMVQYLALTL